MSGSRKLSKETKYIIYGAGEMGEGCVHRFLQEDWNIVGVLDKNKGGYLLPDTNIAVIMLGEEQVDKTEIVVIIALANGNIHNQVASELVASGYRYIVFLPMNLQISYHKKSYMTNLYNNLINGKLNKDNILECYSDFSNNLFDDRDAIITEADKMLVVWINQEIAFTETIESYQGDKSRLPQKEELYNNNIIARMGYTSLFHYLDGKEVDINEYLTMFPYIKTDLDIKKVLTEREKLYRVFKKELSKGNIQFFIDGAPEAIWNTEGCFNLVGGHHRTIFLMHSGYRYFPVRITRRDYLRWKNDIILEKVENYMQDNKICNLKTPIPHPSFINMMSEREDGVLALINKIQFFLYSKKIKYVGALDISMWDGYFARIAKRMHIPNVYCIVESGKTNFLRLMNELLYLTDIKMMDIFDHEADEFSDKFELVFAMDIMKKIVDKEKRIKFVKQMDNLTEKYMFWETNVKEDVGYILSSTGFSEYELLSKECVNGEIVETGVFIK